MQDFGDIASIEINEIFKFIIKNIITKVICVSNIVWENIILRTQTSHTKTIVIPNAIDSTFYSKWKC